MSNEQKIIDLSKIARTLWSRRKTFYKVWPCVFLLACIWILPQPRYYTTEVKLAPEISGEDLGSGLSSIASSFGFRLGGMGGQDAIYPELYPDLFQSPEFIVSLFGIQVTTKDGSVTANYHDYMKSHRKRNPLTAPFLWIFSKVKKLFEAPDETALSGGGGINPFRMSRKDLQLMKGVIENIKCAVDRKTSVITINVKDQDPLVCALLADSVKQHLQSFIIRYRTSKVSQDIVHYRQMCRKAKDDYNKAVNVYSRYCDTHRGNILQASQGEKDKMERNIEIKQNALTALETQLQAAQVKLQEKTPAFTTLKSATVPFRPAGPKRMLFVVGMLLLATIFTASYILYKETAKTPSCPADA